MHDVSPENQDMRHTIAHAFMRWTRGVGAKFRTLRYVRWIISKSYAITLKLVGLGGFRWRGLVRALHAVHFRAKLFSL